jgi:hypothetical protein
LRIAKYEILAHRNENERKRFSLALAKRGNVAANVASTLGASYFGLPAGVPGVPLEPGGASPGVLKVPAPEPGGLGRGRAKPESDPDPDEVAPPDVVAEPDVLPVPAVPLAPSVAGVPDVPVDWPGVAAPGALNVPDVVGAPGALGSRAAEPEALSALVPDEEPEVIEPDFLSPDPIAPQAPSTKTHAKGMIHLFMR